MPREPATNASTSPKVWRHLIYQKGLPSPSLIARQEILEHGWSTHPTQKLCTTVHRCRCRCRSPVLLSLLQWRRRGGSRICLQLSCGRRRCCRLRRWCGDGGGGPLLGSRARLMIRCCVRSIFRTNLINRCHRKDLRCTLHDTCAMQQSDTASLSKQTCLRSQTDRTYCMLKPPSSSWHCLPLSA